MLPRRDGAYDLSGPEFDDVRSLFSEWRRFMHDNVEFQLDGDIHTYGHSTRVLLHCLLIAKELGLSEDERTVLAKASCFHDSRRVDDWIDAGHGQRAAEYYCKWCRDNGSIEDSRASLVMAYHDCDDRVGEAAIQRESDDRALVLYRIFKDADALDRVRIGDLDERYLRTAPAKEMGRFAKDLLRRGAEDILGLRSNDIH